MSYTSKIECFLIIYWFKVFKSLVYELLEISEYTILKLRFPQKNFRES